MITLAFTLSANDDEQLDCFFCHMGGSHGKPCALSMVSFGQGRVEVIGVHRTCVDWHNMRQSKLEARRSVEEAEPEEEIRSTVCLCGRVWLGAGVRGITDAHATHTRERCIPYGEGGP